MDNIEELVKAINELMPKVRAMPVGADRAEFAYHQVIPLFERAANLGYTMEMVDKTTGEYKPRKVGEPWEHPTQRP